MTDESDATLSDFMQTQLGTVLYDGYTTLAENEEFTFTPYRRTILPVDGWVVWVKAVDVAPITTKGSLHYNARTAQEESATWSDAAFLFTTSTPLQPMGFEYNGPLSDELIWVNRHRTVVWSIDQQGQTYDKAKMFDYSGSRLPPQIEGALIDDPADIENLQVLNNSAPWFLDMASTQVPGAQPWPCGPLSPAGLNAPDQPMKLASFHEYNVTPLGNGVWKRSQGRKQGPYQLVKASVRLTLWGSTAQEATIARDRIIRYGMAGFGMGITNSPVIHDEFDPTPSFRLRGNRKTIELEVTYWQGVAAEEAQRYIRKVVPTIIPIIP